MKPASQSPSTKPKSTAENRRQKPLRWNLHLASREFGTHREIIERRRREVGIEPGPDGKFSTRQIAAMIHGDREAELLRKLTAERQSAEIRAQREAGELMRTDLVHEIVRRGDMAIRQIILSSPLPDSTKDQILLELTKLDEVDWKNEAKLAGGKRR